LVGLSRAELTLLPVARSFWVVASSEAVDCSESRFWRTDAERVMPDMMFSFWRDTSDASPIVSFGDRATLFPRCYPLVKSHPANCRNNYATAVNTNRALTDGRLIARIACLSEHRHALARALIQLRFAIVAQQVQDSA